MTVASRTLRLGTRRSALALAQAGRVAADLRAQGHEVALVEVVTEGDRSAAALTALGGTGVFVTELRRRLADGAIDVAVHSLKDLPTAPAPGLVVAAVPTREDPRDALVSRDRTLLTQLARGATVGTGSPRRAAQLRAMGLGLDVVPLRGNVDTRLRRVAEGDLDAVVVAAAGLTRLGRLDEAAELLDPGQMLPAPGQGALAVECRADDESLVDVVRRALDDPATRAAVSAERVLLEVLEAGCTAPVGALADIAVGDSGEDEIYLRGAVTAPDGSRAVRLSITGPIAEGDRLGRQLAGDLLDAGAAALIGESS
ncbi:MAG TPA: hydroxymethylbilane synthase [Mycobacteriales bacterium]|nr:hydroxymethylbilane synthase [Mycobacteriales bacterium]